MPFVIVTRTTSVTGRTYAWNTRACIWPRTSRKALASSVRGVGRANLVSNWVRRAGTISERRYWKFEIVSNFRTF